MSNPNDPAYPTDSYPSGARRGGMTTRQEFVKAAMQGLLARSPGLGFAETIKSAIEIADATLAEEARTRAKA